MATEISYRHEYLTGFAMAPDRTRMRVTVMAFNHGPVEEHVRVLGITLHGHVLHDGGDEKVPVASQAWLTQFDLFDKYEFFPPGSIGGRVRILTTSANLILSAGHPGNPGVGNTSEGPDSTTWSPFPYHGPNDFVVFTLHGPPEVPLPVGPVANA